MDTAAFHKIFCDHEKTQFSRGHKIFSYNLPIIITFVKFFLLSIWNLLDVLMVMLSKCLFPSFQFTQRPRIQRLKITRFILVFQHDTVLYISPCPPPALLFQHLCKACRSFQVNKGTKSHSDSKVLDLMYYFQSS